jgi:hypothetical protein
MRNKIPGLRDDGQIKSSQPAILKPVIEATGFFPSRGSNLFGQRCIRIIPAKAIYTGLL